MVSTHGTARLPLPHAVTAVLDSNDFLSLPAADGEPFFAYRAKPHPQLLVILTTSNLAGDRDSVIVSMKEGTTPLVAAELMSADRFRALIRQQMHRLFGGTVVRS